MKLILRIKRWEGGRGRGSTHIYKCHESRATALTHGLLHTDNVNLSHPRDKKQTQIKQNIHNNNKDCSKQARAPVFGQVTGPMPSSEGGRAKQGPGSHKCLWVI